MGDVTERFHQAAIAAKSEGWPTLDSDEIVQELWVRYLEDSWFRREVDRGASKKFLRWAARAICSKELQDARKFTADYDYSVDTVWSIIRGNPEFGPMAREDFDEGLDRLCERNHDHYRLVLRRCEGDIPKGPDKHKLSRAVVALTDEINRAGRERESEWSDEPGKTLGDGLGRPKPQPPGMDQYQEEARPASGYYERRKYDPD